MAVGLTGSHTGDETVLDKAREWLEECMNDHASCSNDKQSNWLPTRLLDVAVPGDLDMFRVLNTAQHSLEGICYITLSHRWGKADFLKLTKENQEELAKCHPISSLPKTFQDAITVCRALHFRYLWINCLCIVQDSSEDREKESKNMCNVFANSSRNISATEVGDSSVELFRERDIRPVLVDMSQTKLPEFKPSTYIIEETGLEERVNNAALARRGLVFQERILSPRVLHIMDDQVILQCPTTLRFETFVGHELYNEDFSNWKMVLHITTLSLKSAKSVVRFARDGQRLWRVIHSVTSPILMTSHGRLLALQRKFTDFLARHVWLVFGVAICIDSCFGKLTTFQNTRHVQGRKESFQVSRRWRSMCL